MAKASAFSDGISRIVLEWVFKCLIMEDSINPRPPQFSQPDIGQLNRFVSLIQLEACSALGGPGLGLALDFGLELGCSYWPSTGPGFRWFCRMGRQWWSEHLISCSREGVCVGVWVWVWARCTA